MQRINQVLAAAGLGSRREVEQLVLQGRVEIDDQTITKLSTRVDPEQSKIKVDGQVLKRRRLVYYALNKPKGVLSTNRDPSGRARVIDFVPDRDRVFSVGRLDQHSEGLMLMTNDGLLAQRLAHPRFRIQKTYFVVVAGVLTTDELAKLKKGVYLAEGMARIDGARIRKTRKTYTELEIQLSEGKNREIRRILARAGHKVLLLRRIAIGPLRLAELPVGAARDLTAAEVKALYACTMAAKSTSKPQVENAAARSKKPPKVVADDQPTALRSVPLEPMAEDDFGLGLEADYQYDDSQLQVGDDALLLSGGEDSDWDDDFAFDASVARRSGSVLDYDQSSGQQRSKQAGQSRRSGSAARIKGSRGPGSRGSGGSRGKSGSHSIQGRDSGGRSTKKGSSNKGRSSGQASRGHSTKGLSGRKPSKSRGGGPGGKPGRRPGGSSGGSGR
ncbi:MAG: rRNA pseudouridine synthase [Pirellulaceae bacterium]|nr:rRNA pseudouridine synthase [Pirellulaceae bacterium]